MAKYVMLDAHVVLNAVVLSDHVKSVTITWEAEDQDSTAMGVSGSRTHDAGLKNWSAELECYQDHAAGSVDATLFPLLGAAAFACEFRPTSAAVSATNPKFTGNAILLSYSPLAGEVGEYSMTSVPPVGFRSPHPRHRVVASRNTPFTLQVVGLKEFQRDLRAISADFPRELRQANKKAAEVVATEARSRAPKLSGRLAASIKAQASTRSAKVKAGTPSRTPYAAVQEFGWPGHNIEPQPYLYPAIAAKQGEVVDVYYDAVDDLLDRAF